MQHFQYTSTPEIGNLKKESNVDPLENVKFDMKLVIEPSVYQKIMYWINKSDFEVSGLGKIVVDKENNIIRVIDAILLKQENTSVATELDAVAVGKAMFLLKDAPGDLRWWWHSHVDMPVFWSGTDTATIKQLAMGGWFVSTVFNKKREMKSAFSQSAPVKLIFDNLDTSIESFVHDSVISKWDKEYKENVTVKQFSSSLMSGMVFHGAEHYTQGSFWQGEDIDEVRRAIEAEEPQAKEEEVVDPNKDYTAEFEARAEALTDRFTAGNITMEEYETLMSDLEDQYEFPEDAHTIQADKEEAKAMDLSIDDQGRVCED